ncbi:MAG TPA: Uma2 family endonuclease, partial [Thermoanaerobaculia bacterium]
QPALDPDRHLRIQLPLALGSDALPEPDLAIAPGSWRDHLKSHPTTALLVVEVSETSMTHDRERKRRVYARAGIPEYWIFYVGAKEIEVCREPRSEDYRSRVILKAGDTLSPLCCPGLSIRVEALLPYV